MLLQQSDLKNFTLHAKDAEIGRCRDFLFDDDKWTLRYMEASTGKWLLGRRVLISPLSLGEPDLDAHQVPVALTKEQIENAPGAHEDEPVSEKFEREYYGYFGYPYYWVGGDVWGLHGYPTDLLDAHYRQETPDPLDEKAVRESHLRSMHEISGYSIHAVGGHIGHVADFILDTKNWAVRYLVVDTRRWLPGPHLLVAPQWIERVSWHEKDVFVDLEKDMIASAPKFEPPVTRDDEIAIFNHFGRAPYWSGDWEKHAGPRTSAGRGLHQR